MSIGQKDLMIPIELMTLSPILQSRLPNIQYENDMSLRGLIM